MLSLLNPENYFFSWYAVPNTVVSTLIFAIGLFVFLQNKKSSSHIFFFLFCLSLNLWLYGRAWAYISKSPENALLLTRHFTSLGVFFIAPLVFAFSSFWLGLYPKQKKLVHTGFVLASIFYLIVIFTPYGIPAMKKYFWGYYPNYGIANRIFIVFFFVYFILAFFNFFSSFKGTKDPIRRKQLQTMTIAFSISFTGSFDYLPKVVDIALYPFGYVSVLIWTLVMGYSIVRYRTLDIQTVIHKTIMWFLTSSVLGIPLILLFYAAKDWLLSVHPLIFIAATFGVFALFTLYSRHLQPHVDHLFQRRQWDLTKANERFTDELVHLRSLEDVVRHTLNTIKTIFYVAHATLLLHKEGKESFDLFYGDLKTQTLAKYNRGNQFIKWLESHDSIILLDHLSIDPRLSVVLEEAKEYFSDMNAKLCIPLVVNQRLIGVLNVGEKQTLKRFTLAELNFLSDLRRSAAIAFSNALHIIAIQENLRKWNEELEQKVEERTKQLKEIQSQLVQAEKLATIGTLAGGVAHEINNPLTAVLTNAQILKMTANAEDADSISLIEEGAKRCQAIIQKLMKYSRKPSEGEKVEEVNLYKVVENAIAFLNYQLKQDNIQLVMDGNQKAGTVKGNANELEQVVTNLILNAKDAIKKGNHPGKIEVRTFEQNRAVGVVVSDNGIGIAKKNLSRIFDPFFTTKEIGKGTGLGLSISFGIVEKHGGKISVKSEEGHGATFTVELPKSD